MPTKKLFISDARMLALISHAIEINLVASERQFLQSIDFNVSNITNIRNGNQSFTKEHIYNACKFTGASADWIFGFNSEMKRKKTDKPIKILKQAVAMIEQELKKIPKNK
jgi:hypothetical protein